MKNRKLFGMIGVLAGVAFGGNTPLHAAKLNIGDPAPDLQVAKWVQGDAVKAFEPGKAYLVEFWATWCGPCKVSIPHLNELHQKFKDKDLVVIGQDCWERDEALVEPFIKKMGEKMTYRVALDDKSSEKDGAMAATWMQAAERNGIPSAFVVNKQGKIAWIGHPMSLKDSVLEEILAGSFDLKKAATDYEASEKSQKQRAELSRKLGTSLQKKNWDDAEAAVAEMEKVLPGDQRDAYAMVRFQIQVGRGNYDAAYKGLSAYSDAHQNEAMLQNQIAWTIVSRKGLEKRDMPLAEKAAERANKAAKGEDPNILDTLARIQFMNDKKQEAVATQQKAAELADGKQKVEFEATLASYKSGKLPDAAE